MTIRKQFLAFGAAALLATTGAGCRTANYNLQKVNGKIQNANVQRLEQMANLPNAPVSLSPQTSLSYEQSKALYDTYNGNLAPQRITFAYQIPDQEGNFGGTLDTTGPFNVRGNVFSLNVIEHLLTQVPDNATTVTYDLGIASKEDTLSPRTPGNKLSSDDGINLVRAYSNSGCNNFVIRVKEASKIGKRLRARDDYYVEIDFNQPEFKAEKRRKDFRYLTETGLDGLIASMPLLGNRYGYVTPAVAIAVDGVDGLVAYVEGQKAPKNALLSSDTHLITSLPKPQARTISVLDNSARTGSKQLAFVNLVDKCNNPNGVGVVFLDESTYGLCSGPNCASFCTSKDRGSELLRLLRGWSRFVPIVIEHTKTKVYEYGGGRNGGPGENSFSGGDRNGQGGGENSFGGGRGAGGN